MTSAFDRLVALLDFPMAIVTAAAGGERSGCLVGFTTQCSMKPPRYVVCISKLNHTCRIASAADVLVVHFPGPAGRGPALATLFGEETGDEVDKFAQCSWSPGPDGVTPVLDDVPRWFAGRIVDRVDFGDHIGHVVEPVDAACEDEGPQLGFQSVKDMDPGHPIP